MNLNELNEQNILKFIADRVKNARLNENITQAELAKKSGLSLRTITNLEMGKSNISLLSLINVLKVLGEINQLEHFLPQENISPIQLSEVNGKLRQRASKPKKVQKDGWQWGEDK